MEISSSFGESIPPIVSEPHKLASTWTIPKPSNTFSLLTETKTLAEHFLYFSTSSLSDIFPRKIIFLGYLAAKSNTLDSYSEFFCVPKPLSAAIWKVYSGKSPKSFSNANKLGKSPFLSLIVPT